MDNLKMNSTKKGHFILADITGFTSFVAGSELEHSQQILSQILNSIVKKFTPQFDLVEIEGDAVFLFAPAEKFSRGEIILELIESVYYEFRDTKSSFRRMIVCNCKACEMTSQLDLKFIVHSGNYVLNDVAGKSKPLGTSVNTVHRLSKNKVTESTGWKAYALFTEESKNQLEVTLEESHYQKEFYDHIGEINTYSINLDHQYKNLLNARLVFISQEDSDYFVERNYPVSQSILWEWVNNPKKRSKWLKVTNWNVLERPFGRTGKGATNHCANSNFIENILDYRPFDYYTSELKGKNLEVILTGRFKPISEGTKFIWLIKIKSSLPKWIKKLYCILFLKQGLKITNAFDKLDELLKEEIQLNNINFER
jgi:hypothetical protein